VCGWVGGCWSRELSTTINEIGTLTVHSQLKSNHDHPKRLGRHVTVGMKGLSLHQQRIIQSKFCVRSKGKLTGLRKPKIQHTKVPIWKLSLSLKVKGITFCPFTPGFFRNNQF